MDIDAAIRANTEKMRAANVPEPSIRAFALALESVASGHPANISESCIKPIQSLPNYCDLPPIRDSQVLEEFAIVKLNGGLGTGMGLECAKSLLHVKDGQTFLDLIAKQVLFRRGKSSRISVPLIFMNSFSTHYDSVQYLSRFPDLMAEPSTFLMQSMVPKIRIGDLMPASCGSQPKNEWCPPGHGDFYPTLFASGLIPRLLALGIRYLFVSNSDNLGATLDPTLAQYFASSGLSFLMEVAERTPSDRKGGHLASRLTDDRLILREFLQTVEADIPHFQNIERHRFFNTNNLWIDLASLSELLAIHRGFVRLAVIQNRKPIIPSDLSSEPIIQIETAMGCAIQEFEKSGALVVPRSRFIPVKTTSDLLLIRSDAYRVLPDATLNAAFEGSKSLPLILLDESHYKLLENFEKLIGGAIPSVLNCSKLKVNGRCRFETGVVCEGDVEFTGTDSGVSVIPGGYYRDVRVEVECG